MVTENTRTCFNVGFQVLTGATLPNYTALQQTSSTFLALNIIPNYDQIVD
jgi:hypothetical protein